MEKFTDGLILTIVSLLFQPFYLIFHVGLIGVIVSLLPFQFLLKGLIYLVRSFCPRPAIQLTSQGLEFNTILMFQKRLKWNEIRSIEWKEEEVRLHTDNNRGGGIKLHFRISDYEKYFIVIQTNEEKNLFHIFG